MAAPTIIKGEEHFFISKYEGNGGGQRVGNFVPYTDNGTIAKSCIFNAPDDPDLTRNLGSNGNRSKFTISTWIKRNSFPGSFMAVVTGGLTSSNDGFFFNSSQQAYFYFFGAEALITNRTFEDTSKWYHFVLRVDSSLSTADDRVRLYVDGDQITSFATRNNPSQDATTGYFLNSSNNIRIGRHGSSTLYEGDYYLAETILADGQSYGPDTFGITDTSTGRWIPKDVSSGITYGTHGFRMHYANSAGQTIGDDLSGNGNDLTVTNLAASDITTDSPTQNHATLAVNGSNISSSFSEGNLKVTLPTSSAMTGGLSTLKMVSGKYYMEATVDSVSSAGLMLGIMGSDRYSSTSEYAGKLSDSYSYYSVDGNMYNNSSSVSFGNAYTTNDIIGIAVDLDNNKLYFSKNGTFQNSANPSAGTGGQSIISAKSTVAGFYRFTLTDAGTGSTDIVTANFGQKSFAYTPPTGFVALQQDNLPETSKDLPDFVWSKSRDNTESHTIYDSSRGVLKQISSNNTTAENTQDDGLQKFLKGGYQCEDHTRINQSGISYVSWKWHANGGTTSANTDGSGATQASTIQANQTAGFSIVTFSSSSAGSFNNESFAHGLSQAPEWVIYKRLDSTSNWVSYHKSAYTSNQHGMFLDTTAANAVINAETTFFPTAPTSSVFSYTNNSATAASANFVAYCWHGVPGFSKFGGYTGNGNSNGVFVYLGFKPSLIIIKSSSNSTDWVMYDNKRSPSNTGSNSTTLYPNLNSADASAGGIDFLSNGFKARSTNGYNNGSSRTYIYMAFAEHPFVGNGTNPVTAR